MFVDMLRGELTLNGDDESSERKHYEEAADEDDKATAVIVDDPAPHDERVEGELIAKRLARLHHFNKKGGFARLQPDSIALIPIFEAYSAYVDHETHTNNCNGHYWAAVAFFDPDLARTSKIGHWDSLNIALSPERKLILQRLIVYFQERMRLAALPVPHLWTALRGRHAENQLEADCGIYMLETLRRAADAALVQKFPDANGQLWQSDLTRSEIGPARVRIACSIACDTLIKSNAECLQPMLGLRERLAVIQQWHDAYAHAYVELFDLPPLNSLRASRVLVPIAEHKMEETDGGSNDGDSNDGEVDYKSNVRAISTRLRDLGRVMTRNYDAEFLEPFVVTVSDRHDCFNAATDFLYALLECEHMSFEGMQFALGTHDAVEALPFNVTSSARELETTFSDAALSTMLNRRVYFVLFELSDHSLRSFLDAVKPACAAMRAHGIALELWLCWSSIACGHLHASFLRASADDSQLPPRRSCLELDASPSEMLCGRVDEAVIASFLGLAEPWRRLCIRS